MREIDRDIIMLGNQQDLYFIFFFKCRGGLKKMMRLMDISSPANSLADIVHDLSYLTIKHLKT